MKLRFEKEEERDVQTIDPAPVTALAALWVGALMVHAGVAKRQLTWGRRRPSRERTAEVMQQTTTGVTRARHPGLDRQRGSQLPLEPNPALVRQT